MSEAEHTFGNVQMANVNLKQPFHEILLVKTPKSSSYTLGLAVMLRKC